MWTELNSIWMNQQEIKKAFFQERLMGLYNGEIHNSMSHSMKPGCPLKLKTVIAKWLEWEHMHKTG